MKNVLQKQLPPYINDVDQRLMHMVVSKESEEISKKGAKGNLPEVGSNTFLVSRMEPQDKDKSFNIVDLEELESPLAKDYGGEEVKVLSPQFKGEISTRKIRCKKLIRYQMKFAKL